MASEDGFDGMDVASMMLDVVRRKAMSCGIGPGDWSAALVREACIVMLTQLPPTSRRDGIRILKDTIDGYAGEVLKELDKDEREQGAAVNEAVRIINNAVANPGTR